MTRFPSAFLRLFLHSGCYTVALAGGVARVAANEQADISCCVGTRDLQMIGPCVSGPQGYAAPEACPQAGLCYVVSGEVNLGRSAESAVDRLFGPLPSRAFCTSDLRPGPVGLVAYGNNIDLFSVFDAEQDGDLDLRDVAHFMNTFETAPQRTQTDARLVAARCCFSLAEQRRVAGCLSGPGGRFPQGACEEQGTCVLGFSNAVRPGDYMQRLCRSGPFVPPAPSDTSCDTLPFAGSAVLHQCAASRDAGITPFETLDGDGDADFDLADLAGFQNQFGAP